MGIGRLLSDRSVGVEARASGAISLALLVAVCGGCDPAPAWSGAPDMGLYFAVGTPLVSADEWRVTAAEEDPWIAERPREITCPEYAFEVEPGGFEIDTGDCEYAVVQQPSLAPIAPGDTVALIFWHNALTAESPGMGHVALQVGDHLVWEVMVPIPGPGATYIPTVVADFAAPVGSPIYLHLHNHGANTWLFSTVEVR